jgi:hypothetical protein
MIRRHPLQGLVDPPQATGHWNNRELAPEVEALEGLRHPLRELDWHQKRGLITRNLVKQGIHRRTVIDDQGEGIFPDGLGAVGVGRGPV